jgi:phage tail-like protein
MSDQTIYRPVGFLFKLTFTGILEEGGIGFKEVSGISMDLETEEISEGGENQFTHRLPSAVKFNNLILKRGLADKNSELVKWCMDTFSGQLDKPVVPKNISVRLLDEKAKPLMSWDFHSAWPVKWSVADLGSVDNNLAIETLEFSYNYFTTKPLK